MCVCLVCKFWIYNSNIAMIFLLFWFETRESRVGELLHVVYVCVSVKCVRLLCVCYINIPHTGTVYSLHIHIHICM